MSYDTNITLAIIMSFLTFATTYIVITELSWWLYRKLWGDKE